MALAATLWALLPAAAQEDKALRAARTDLRLALEQLEQTRKDIAQEEAPLILEVERLDEQVANRARDLKIKIQAQNDIVGDQLALDQLLASRKGEYDYTLNLLASYSKGYSGRLHPLENEARGGALEDINAQLAVEGISKAEEIALRLKVMEQGFDRIGQVAGGAAFPAKVVAGEARQILSGTGMVVGPQGYFAGEGAAGYTNATVSSQGYPELAPLVGDDAAAVETLATEKSATIPLDASGGKALLVEQTKKGLSDYIDGGGTVGLAILGLGLLGIAIAVFKFFEITRFNIPSRKKVNAILDDLVAGNAPEAKVKAEAVSGLSGKMVRAGVDNFYEKRRILEDSLVEKLGAIQPKLERGLPFLALAAAAAPMMGLLGTVLGIMKTFDMMAVFGTGNAQNFSAGIGEALITTAMGLVVAIPMIIVHGMLKSLSKARMGRAEAVALAFMNGTSELSGSERRKVAQDLNNGDDGDDFDEMEIQPA